jgi:hypothetical protein
VVIIVKSVHMIYSIMHNIIKLNDFIFIFSMTQGTN